MGRILPYLFLLFVVAFLDRVNVSYAALQMTGSLGFTPEVYGFGAGVFFFGYFLLEIPGSLIVEKWGARRWIARIMVTWGLVAVGMGFIQTANQFYALRFLLGAAEAGFFPGLIVYLSHWFCREDRAKAVALFMAAVPLSNVLGAPASGYLLGIDWLGLEGWRWLFVLEGIPAIVLGVVTLFYLTDRPRDAAWLEEDEREWIVSELDREREAKESVRRYRIVEAFRDRKVLTLTAIYVLIVTSSYGLVFWLPTIVKGMSGSSNFRVTLISAIPYLVAFVGMILTGWSSDRRQERRWHASVPMFVASVGFLLAVLAFDVPALAVAMFCLAAYGVYAHLPSFWALPATFLSGTAAAATTGFVNAIGNLGGFLGPYAVGFVTERTGSPAGGLLFLSALAFTASLLVLTLKTNEPANPRG